MVLCPLVMHPKKINRHLQWCRIHSPFFFKDTLLGVPNISPPLGTVVPSISSRLIIGWDPRLADGHMFEHAEGIITFPKLRRNMRAFFCGFFCTRAWDFTTWKCKEGFIHVATAKKKLTQWGFNWMIHGNFHPKMGNIFFDVCVCVCF